MRAQSSSKNILQKKTKDPEFKVYFDGSKSVFDLCRAIAHARQVREVSQKELAKRVGTTQSVIARLENGKYGRIPGGLSLLTRVASALELRLVVSFEK